MGIPRTGLSQPSCFWAHQGEATFSSANDMSAFNYSDACNTTTNNLKKHLVNSEEGIIEAFLEVTLK